MARSHESSTFNLSVQHVIIIIRIRKKWTEKLSPIAQRVVFTRYSYSNQYYTLFLLDTKKTIGSADIFFRPTNTEGASHIIYLRITQSLTPIESQHLWIDYTYTNKSELSFCLWRKWMSENHQEANDQFNNGHRTISKLMMGDFMDRKKVVHFGALY